MRVLRQTSSLKGAPINVPKLTEWVRRHFFRWPDHKTPKPGDKENLDITWGRNRQAHDLLHQSLEMLIAARQAEADPKTERTEKNGATDGHE